MSLSPILESAPRPNEVVLLQSSTAQTSLPILQQILKNAALALRNQIILVCLLHAPASLATDTTSFKLVDLTTNVPGYSDSWVDPSTAILAAVKQATAEAKQITVVMDSVDTLASDMGSTSATYKFLYELNTLVRAHTVPSQLILHTLSPSKLTPLLVQPSFATSLTQIIAHPTVLLTHLATAYLTPPPPASPDVKFWAVFLPMSERGYEIDQLVFAASAEGSGSRTEFVVEVLVRGSGKGSAKRKPLDRILQGWSEARGGICSLTELDSLKNVFARKPTVDSAPDPTQNLSFNLNLTSSQQESRAQVPLPYAHEGQPPGVTAPAAAAIFYDPDSADDIDDDDPDEDLDI